MSKPLAAAEKRKTKTVPSKRQRLKPEERENLIVDAAIEFFAEHGFEGTTRQLAERLGITQPLLYRYFPTKQKLIERVYEEIYVRRWNPKWSFLIKDRSRPLTDRLIEFYQQYAQAVYDKVWVRTFLYSGLMGIDINDRYLAIIEKNVLKPICIELRHENGLPSTRKFPLSDEELELAWGLHGMFFYRAVRHFAYGLSLVADIDSAIENDVRLFMKGAPTAQKKILKRKTTEPITQ